VNAIGSERTRRGDDMVRLPRRRTLRRVFATGDDSWMDREVRDLRVDARSRDRAGSPKRGEPHGRLRGATNPRTVERADLRIRSLRRKPLKPGGTARAEHCSGRGSPEPKSGRRPRRDVDAVTVVSAKGRSMNPKRGVQNVEVSLRVGWDGQDRANRYASEQERCRCLDPMRSIHGRGGEDQTSHTARDVSDDTPLSRPWL